MSGCCKVIEAERKTPCPGCGAVGLPVGEATVAAMLQPGVADRLQGTPTRFCRAPTCSVLYYSELGGLVEKNAARFRIGLKERIDPIPLCYCFGFTFADVRSEVAATGSSSIPARITAEVKAGRCECALRNPSGACCLGEVTKAVRAAQATGASEGREAS